MNTILEKIPAYGMPVAEGPVNKPEKVNAMPPGPPPTDFAGNPTVTEIKPHPPTCRPSEHPGSVPGADVEPGKPGPGMPGGGPPKAPPVPADGVHRRAGRKTLYGGGTLCGDLR